MKSLHYYFMYYKLSKNKLKLVEDDFVYRRRRNISENLLLKWSK